MKKGIIITMALVLLAGPVFSQTPTALGSTTNQKEASGSRFGTDVDNYMGSPVGVA